MLFLTASIGSLFAQSSDYTFVCSNDVLEFTGISGIEASYGNGAYTVSNFGSVNAYTYLTVRVKSEYSSSYQLKSITTSQGNTISIYNNEASIPVYYFPAPQTFSVVFAGEDGEETYGWTIEGPQGLDVYYTNNYRHYSYSKGKYVIDDIERYGTVEISVMAAYRRDMSIVNVTDANGKVYQPVNGVVSILCEDYANGLEMESMTFTVNTKKAEGGELSHATVKLVGDQVAGVEVYVGNISAYDFFDSKTITIEFNPTQDYIFITTPYGEAPYQITVGGKIVPASMWDYDTTLNVTGLKLNPGSEYYPANGSTIEIIMESPNIPFYDVTFTFVNEDTQSFIGDLEVGNAYLRDQEFTDAIANGLSLKQGTGLSMTFNTVDFNVNSITVNGANVSIGAGASYEIASIQQNYSFVFDVTPIKPNTVHFEAPQNFDGIQISDRDQLNFYTLAAAQSDIEIPRSVSEIKVTALDGFVIADNGVTVTLPNGTSESYYGGSYFNVVDGMTVTVDVKSKADPQQSVYTFYSNADVLYFTAINLVEGADGSSDYVATVLDTPWHAPAEEGDFGYYVVDEIPNTSLYMTVKDEYESEYKIDFIEINGQKQTFGGLTTLSIPLSQFTGVCDFYVYFVNEIPAVNITIDANNPSCISRIYNDFTRITTFPSEYDLNNGLQLVVEMRQDCVLNSVTCEGVNLISGYDAQGNAIVSLEGVEEGQTVYVDCSVKEGDFTYYFVGPENALNITFNNIKAEFVDGMYIVSNVYESSMNNYHIEISVAPGYENKYILESVTDGTEEHTWEVTGNTGVVNIPGSQLPREDTFFDVQTRVPSPSETFRTVYLYIDNVTVVNFAHYQGGTSAFFSFNPTGNGQEGVAALDINPQQYEVNVSTKKSISKIETDVETFDGLPTFEMPYLPSTSIVLDLMNAVDGQEIMLFTSGSGISNVFGDENGNVEIFNLQGVRVNPENVTPGFYIVNGKKVIVM